MHAFQTITIYITAGLQSAREAANSNVLKYPVMDRIPRDPRATKSAWCHNLKQRKYIIITFHYILDLSRSIICIFHSGLLYPSSSHDRCTAASSTAMSSGRCTAASSTAMSSGRCTAASSTAMSSGHSGCSSQRATRDTRKRILDIQSDEELCTSVTEEGKWVVKVRKTK